MTAVVWRKSIRSWQGRRGLQRIAIRGRKLFQDVAVASVRRTYLAGTTQESGAVMSLSGSVSRKEDALPLLGYDSLLF